MKTLNQDHGIITLEDSHGREITIEDTDQGLNIVVGFAPLKPAEFVIFRISQWAGPGAE